VKRTLSIVGAFALLAWTALGLFAWSNAQGHFQVTVIESGAASAEAQRASALADELGALHQDLRALSTALGENLEALRDELSEEQTQHAAALSRDVSALRESLRALEPSAIATQQSLILLRQDVAALSAAVHAAPAAEPVAVVAEAIPIEPQPEAETVVETTLPQPGQPAAQPAAEVAPKKRSFLAFQLPSDDLRFDERRAWTLLPALSRVGFDAKSTLHDFSGVSSSITGELEADLSKPGEKPRALLRVEAATLKTGVDGRDEQMRENLAVKDHAQITFELTGFEATKVDAAARRSEGKASGKLTIRGVTREVQMPVQLSIDEARRLCVDGDMSLDLTQFDVPVPNKLGMITMEKDVKLWISLRLRVHPRTER